MEHLPICKAFKNNNFSYVGASLRLVSGCIPLAVLMKEFLDHPLDNKSNVSCLQALLDGGEVVYDVTELSLIPLGVQVLLRNGQLNIRQLGIHLHM
jgi:hypothetical protein